jgi:ubiquitin-conjugating enzyme E2 Z
MKEMGIFWRSDLVNINKGKALILGPEETPFEGCFFVFEFEFPSDYPFNPPNVKVITSDGKTRFHPNLYVDGKVCLSILGTYSGPSWQSTMSLSMILISLKALLDSNPLAHEPGYSNYMLSNPQANQYARFIQHQIIQQTLSELHHKFTIQEFEEELKEIKPKLVNELNKIINEHLEFAETLFVNVPYGMRGSTQWQKLKTQLTIVNEQF